MNEVIKCIISISATILAAWAIIAALNDSLKYREPPEHQKRKRRR